MAGPVLPIDPPQRAEREGGIEKVAEFRTNDRLGVADRAVFQSDGCVFPEFDEHLCYRTPVLDENDDPIPPADKTFDGVPTVDAIGEPFALYAGVKCYAGPEDSFFQDRARAALEQGQGRAIEEVLAEWAAGGTAVATPASAGIQGAIARIEQYLDANYVGRGVILMSRFDAVLAGAVSSIEPDEDEVLTTKVGTKVIASGRVAPGTVFGLGAIIVEHSTPTTRDVMDPEYNRHYGLAEGVYLVAVDCELRIKTTTT